MDALFGLSMDLIMVVLLGLLAVALAAVAYVVLRSRIMFLIGLRNIPRRPAQTVLIVIGLMLSTLIISAAFTIGDTVDYSVTNQAFRILGHLDEAIQPKVTDEFDAFSDTTGLDIPGEQYQRFKEAWQSSNSANIDGVTGVLFEEVPVVNLGKRLSEPSVSLTGLDHTSLEGFPDVISVRDGSVLDIASLSESEAFMNESGADELQVVPGDRVQVWIDRQPHEFTIRDVVEDRVLTGANRSENQEGMVTRLDTVQSLAGHDRVSLIAVSNKGGVRDALSLTEAARQDLREIIRGADLDLEVGASKQEGIDTAELAGNFMATFFLILGLFSIGAGMLLIVMIFVMLAAERKSEMGMARAVGTKRGQLVQMFLSEGMAYNVLSAMIGAGLGILVAFGMAFLMAQIFSTFNISIQPHVTLRSLAISYSLGVVLTFLTVTFASWRISKLNIVHAIRDITDRSEKRMGWKGLAVALAGIVIGGLLFLLGLSENSAFPFALGFSLMAAGVARTLRYFRLPERPVYTTMALVLLVTWGLVAGGRLESLFGELQGDIEMFFLSGIAMVTSSTFLVIYNSDLLLSGISRLGPFFGSVLPALKTAIAYPLDNRFRTGMTLAMISLVVFALTMMSTMNLNFDRIFLADSARGGWDILVLENPNNPVPDLPAALAAAGSDVSQNFRSDARLEMPGGRTASEVRQGDGDYESYPIIGVDEAFVSGGQVPIESRARGFESGEAVWRALTERDDVAVISGLTVRAGFGDQGLRITGIKEGAETFEPVTLDIRDPVTDNTKQVQIIGVISFGSSPTFDGLYVGKQTAEEVFGSPEVFLHYVGLEDASSAKEIAREIESTLLNLGVQAESLKERVDDQQAMSRNFFYLMQGFMGMGLVVGIAAVGVIAFRTVVERRQQIGMLRAIGYKRRLVALSFLIESSFVTLLGVLSGIGLAIWLSYFLVTSDEFPTGGEFALPWLQITLIGLFTYIASLLMTWVPAQQAAAIPTAEALRYE